jgi:predicted ATPase
LAARIDRLAADEKAFLQTLAVIGREFSLRLLAAVVNQSEEAVLQGLARLQAAEFIYEQLAFPEVEYAFKHTLTQEVAYTSLLLEHRRVLHERIAQAIEQLAQSGLDEHYSALAHHYSRSGNTPKAVEYLTLAGQQAVQRSANVEAIRHLQDALSLLPLLADTSERARQELTLHLLLGAPLQATQGPAAPEVEHTYTRARTLCEQIGETAQLFAVLRGLWVLHHVRAELSTARELGEQLLTMAQRSNDSALLLEAHRALGSTVLWLGEFPLARTHLEQASALYDPQQHRALAFVHGGADPGVSCLSDVARTLWFLGYPDQALERTEAALSLAHELSDPFSLGYASSLPLAFISFGARDGRLKSAPSRR